jgi:hypothetical protein
MKVIWFVMFCHFDICSLVQRCLEFTSTPLGFQLGFLGFFLSFGDFRVFVPLKHIKCANLRTFLMAYDIITYLDFTFIQ